MFKSIAVDECAPAAAFLNALQWDSCRFGRSDTFLFTVGNLTVFVWNPDLNAVGSTMVREISLVDRLAGQKDRLEKIEATLPADYFLPFDIDFAQLDLDIAECPRRSERETLFDYIAHGQSVAAETSQMRIGKFLVVDRCRGRERIVGAIGLKSPMYFDGARDKYLGWPPLFQMVNGRRVKSQPAIALRNDALKSIYNISVCMPAAPYDQHGLGKLLAALSLSKPVIAHLEATYGDVVLGMTTTGAWGGSAGQYERIRLGFDQPGEHRSKLFIRTHGAKRSHNYPLHLYSSETYENAYWLIHQSQDTARPYANYKSDEKVRRKLLLAACRNVGLPRRVIATNVIAHYFGAVSLECRRALSTLASLAVPPACRSIAVAEAYANWVSGKPSAPLFGVTATRLSEKAT